MSASAPPGRPGPTLLTTSFGTLLVLIAYTSPLTTLAPTAADLDLGTSAQTWVLTGTLVGLAALLLVAGSAADDYGRRRVFAAGSGLLVVATALSAAAPGTGLFLAGRVLQGCSAAAIIAPSLGLISRSFPAGPGRVKALGTWGAAVGLGIALGPVYAAEIEDVADWRMIYWLLAILAVLLLVLSFACLDDSRSDEPRRLDPFGVLTIAAGASCLVAGLSEGREGWGRPVVVLLLVAGVLLVGLFVLAESKVAEPMLDLALFRSPGFIAATTGALFTGMSIVGLMSYLPSVIQRTSGVSPPAASLILAIWSGLSVVSAFQARRLATRLEAASQVALSLLLCGIGEAALYGTDAGGSWVHLIPGLVVAGIGSGVLNAALARLAVSSVPPHRAAMGSGANNSARYLGSALGVAIVVTVVNQANSDEDPVRAMADGTNQAVLIAAALCMLGAAVALWARIAEARTARSATALAVATPAAAAEPVRIQK